MDKLTQSVWDRISTDANGLGQFLKALVHGAESLGNIHPNDAVKQHVSTMVHITEDAFASTLLQDALESVDWGAIVNNITNLL